MTPTSRTSVRRHGASALAAAALAAVMIPAALIPATAALAAGGSATSASLHASPQRLARAGNVSVSTHLSTQAGTSAGQTVVLQGRESAKYAWTALASGRTDGAGNLHFTVVGLGYDYQLRLDHPSQTVGGRSYLHSDSNVASIAVGGPRTFRSSGSDATRTASFEFIPGDKLSYSVSECASCGYRWSVTSSSGRSVVAKTSETTTSQSPPGTVGGNQTRTFNFAAKSSGAASYVLSYTGPDGKVSQRITLSMRAHN